MTRVLVFTHEDEYAYEIAPDDIFELTRTEEINGEHSLEITTTRVMSKGERVLVQDDARKWREFVVARVDEAHQSGDRPIGTYWCPWSLMYDLATTTVQAMPGVQTPVAAGAALSAALGGTERWNVGTVTETATGGASMYYMSGYQALGVVTEIWGGEIDATIEVSQASGIIARKVDLYHEQGSSTARRRFDYARDMNGIRRRVSEEPVPCRILPRGKGEQTESGGVGRKVTIESVNGGRDYLQNAETAPLLRVPDGNGGWEYPTVIVENGDMETPADLKAWAESVLEERTTPKVTYEADVVQLAAAGLDPKGLALGDRVQCVDRAFQEGGLRVEGRVTKMVVNELDQTDVRVTVGHIDGGVAGALADMGKALQAVGSTVEGLTVTTADYLNNILDRINAEINANGGYTYITDGQGIRTYDKAVTDPLVGAEADQVVEIKGGSIRIANSRTAGGDWDWRSVFVSGHILADLVTAAKITAGFIGSPSGNYWNLDTGELRMAATTQIGGKTFAEIAAEQASAQVQAFVEGDYADDMEEIGRQVDGKAETWYQSSDPSTSWTADQKAEHVGDLWYKTTDGTTWRWDGSSWAEQDVPDAVFDAIDGKMQVFVSQPVPPYNVGDLWVQGPNGDIMRCAVKRSSGSFQDSDWLKASKYTDDAALTLFLSREYADDMAEIDQQLDKKAETWYQQADPSTAWDTSDLKAAHKGDLWYRTTDDTTWRWNGASWAEQAAPAAVFDAIDGKMQVFTAQPVPPYEKGDIWVQGNAGDLLHCVNSRLTGSYAAGDWARSTKYTDDSAVSALDSSLDQAEVFKRLTNNGVIQGLYMGNDGQVYLNASYIKTGSLLANLITAGKMQSADGKVYFDLDAGEVVSSKLRGVDNDHAEGFDSANWYYPANIIIDVSTQKVASAEYAAACRIYKDTYTAGGLNVTPAGKVYDTHNPTGFAKLSTQSVGIHIAANNGTGHGLLGYSNLELDSNQARLYVFPSGQRSGSMYGITITNSGSYNIAQSSTTVAGNLSASGTKSRLVATEDYGERLLYSYETPAPLFGDVGGGVVGDDGVCYVEIDDALSETIRADMAYQVFLQKCGEGDVWVAEKAPTHFVVRGTPGLAFDWELKAHQTGFEALRLEQFGADVDDLIAVAELPSPESAYGDYVTEMEQLYSSETEA